MDNGLLSVLGTLIGAGNIFEDKEIYSWTALFIVLDWTQCHISGVTVAVHVRDTEAQGLSSWASCCINVHIYRGGRTTTLESISSLSNTCHFPRQITSSRPLRTDI